MIVWATVVRMIAADNYCLNHVSMDTNYSRLDSVRYFRDEQRKSFGGSTKFFHLRYRQNITVTLRDHLFDGDNK